MAHIYPRHDRTVVEESTTETEQHDHAHLPKDGKRDGGSDLRATHVDTDAAPEAEQSVPRRAMAG